MYNNLFSFLEKLTALGCQIFFKNRDLDYSRCRLQNEIELKGI